MISNFSLLSGKPKKTSCGLFCGGRSVSEFNNSRNLDQKDFVWLKNQKLDYKLDYKFTK